MMTSEQDIGCHTIESSQPIDVGTNLGFVEQPADTAAHCDGHLNQTLQGLPIVGAVTRGEHTDEPSQTLLNAAALDSFMPSLPAVGQFSEEVGDMNINGPTNSMTQPAASGASHVNAAEIIDPVGVLRAVGETLDVTAINSGDAVSENIDPAGAQIGETAMEDITRGNGNGISGGPSSSSSTQRSTANKDISINSTTNTSTVPFQETRSEQEPDELWTSNYNALRAFHTQTGHTRVPRKSGGSLGNWVSRQRGYYKSNLKGHPTPLTKERIQLMEGLGFIWGYNINGTGQTEMSQPPQNQIRLNEIWSNHLKDLREYQTQHGHIRVPRKSGPLGEWARCQRRYNRLNEQGQSTPLTAERKQLLDEMGFDFHPPGDKTGVKRKRVGVDGEPMEGKHQQGGGGSGGDANLESVVWTPAQRKAHLKYNDEIQLLKRAEKSVRDAEKALESAKKRQAAALAKRTAIEAVLEKCAQDVLESELEGHENDDWITMYKRLIEYKERIGNIRFPRGWDKEVEKGEKISSSTNTSTNSPEAKRRKIELEDCTPSNIHTSSRVENQRQDGALMMLSPSLPEIAQTQVEFMTFPDLNTTGDEAIVVTNLHEDVNPAKTNVIDLDGHNPDSNMKEPSVTTTVETKHERPSISDLDLYEWVTRMRKMPKKQLKNWRRQALDKLGFVWHQYDATWSDRYQELIAFKCEHGHTQVPTVHSNLGVWVGTQRKQYTLLQQNKPSHMTSERMQLLNDIGFLWKVNAWDVRFEELKAFNEIYGHFQIPADYPNKKLRPWITTQRSHYRFLQEGKSSQITPERIKLLDSIGFMWKTREDWQTRYEELVEYFKRTGTTSVNRDYTRHPKLYRWVNCQRMEYQKHMVNEPHRLKPEQIQLLDALGFE